MKNLRKKISLLVLGCLAVTVVGCGNSSTEVKNTTAQKDEKPVTLTISAAASLKDAFGDIQKLYAKEHPNVTLQYNFGSSGDLMTQIEQGAPADAFVSAGSKQMEELKQKGLIDETTKKNLLDNEVVLVVPKDSTAAIKGFNDLTSDAVKKIAIGEPKSVPAGQYGQESLKNINILDKVSPKFVQGKDVKQVLSWVETGDADAGIVYETDAKVSKKVKIVAKAPAKSHSPIVYPEAVIKSSKNEAETKAFLKYLSSDSAKNVFKKYGFGIEK